MHTHIEILLWSGKAEIPYLKRGGQGVCLVTCVASTVKQNLFFPNLKCFRTPVCESWYTAPSTCIVPCCEASFSNPAPFSNGVLNERLFPYQKKKYTVLASGSIPWMINFAACVSLYARRIWYVVNIDYMLGLNMNFNATNRRVDALWQVIILYRIQ
jgi:hypothetical protein